MVTNPTKSQTNSWNISLTGIFILFVLYQTIGQNATFLWKTQELDLFVFNRRYFMDTMEGIGGLSVYLGSFLTQFFYIPWLGSLIYLALLLLVSYLTAKAFNLKGLNFPLAFVPSLVLLLTMTELGYMIYVLKINGFVFVTLIGVIGLLLSIILFQKIKPIRFQVIFIIAWLLVTFPVFGAYTLFGGLLMVFMTLKRGVQEKNNQLLIPALTGLSGIVLIPVFYYLLVYHQTFFGKLFFTLLPGFNTKSELLLWLPFVLMALFFILAILWKPVKESKKQTFIQKSLPVVVFLSALVIAYTFSYRDENFKTELAMQSASENEDWHEVLRIARKHKDEPTRLIVMHTNLALYKLGLAGDNLFKYKNGNKPINTPGNIVPIQIAGKFFYYQYGHLNYCYRWCMEEMVEYKMNANNLKYFILSATLNKEMAVAQKYNDVLKATLFYKSWAEAHQPYIDDPERAIKEPALLNILRLNAFEDVLDGDHSMLESFLLNHAAHSRGGNPELIELSILSNLQIKDSELFWPRFFVYVRTQPRIPVHFQEAALLFHYLQSKPGAEQLPLDSQVIRRFQQFLQLSEKYTNQPKELIRHFFFNQFGDTYWYYFFFTDLQLKKKRGSESY